MRAELVQWSRQAASVVRRIAGMPDYAAHLEHLRRCHPNRPIPTEREFYEEFVRAATGTGPPGAASPPAAYFNSFSHSVSHFPVREITAELSFARKS